MAYPALSQEPTVAMLQSVFQSGPIEYLYKALFDLAWVILTVNKNWKHMYIHAGTNPVQPCSTQVESSQQNPRPDYVPNQIAQYLLTACLNS